MWVFEEGEVIFFGNYTLHIVEVAEGFLEVSRSVSRMAVSECLREGFNFKNFVT